MALITTVTATTRARHKRPVPAHSRPAGLFGRPACIPRASFQRREAPSEISGSLLVHQVVELVRVFPNIVQFFVPGGGPAGVFDVDPAFVATYALVGGHAALRPVLDEEIGAPADGLASEKRCEGAAVHVGARAYASPLAKRRRKVYVEREVVGNFTPLLTSGPRTKSGTFMSSS